MKLLELYREINEAPPLPQDWDAGVYKPSTSYKKRIDYALQRAQRMGTGTSRLAFEIEYEGRPTILKVAKNRKGIAQNEHEADILKDYYVKGLGVTIPMIDYDEENYTWLHMEKGDKMTPTVFKRAMGLSPKEVEKLLSYLTRGPSYFVSRDEGERLNQARDNEHLEHLVDLVLGYGLLVGDFGRLANWRLYQGRPVVVDLGLSHDIYKQYYESVNEDEEHYGKSLADSGYPYRTVQIFRAAPARQAQFRQDDWVTIHRKFAKEHADHVAAVDEEDAHVIAAMVNAADVYHEHNPGEFKYRGPEPRRVRVVYKAPAMVHEIVHGTTPDVGDGGTEEIEPWMQNGQDFATTPYGWHESIGEGRVVRLDHERKFIVNPNREQFVNLARAVENQIGNTGHFPEALVKGLLDPFSNDFYIWNPFYMTHDQAEAELIELFGSPGGGFNWDDDEDLFDSRFVAFGYGYNLDRDKSEIPDTYINKDGYDDHPAIRRALGIPNPRPKPQQRTDWNIEDYIRGKGR